MKQELLRTVVVVDQQTTYSYSTLSRVPSLYLPERYDGASRGGVFCPSCSVRLNPSRLTSFLLHSRSVLLSSCCRHEGACDKTRDKQLSWQLETVAPVDLLTLLFTKLNVSQRIDFWKTSPSVSVYFFAASRHEPRAGNPPNKKSCTKDEVIACQRCCSS